jgi:uncharacterized protein
MPPIELADLQRLHTQVLLLTVLLAMVFGAIAQRTHFCTMGAVSDIVNMGDSTRMRQWVAAMGVAAIGFGVMFWLGWVDPRRTIQASTRWIWLSAAVGGLTFGFGMVLASGCGSKTLVRMGGGSLKSLVVFIVMGLAAYATLRGITGVLRVNTVDKVALDMPQGVFASTALAGSTGMAPGVLGLVLGLLFGGAALGWALSSREFRRAENLLAGLGIGGVVVAMWLVSAKLGFVAEHPETLEEVFVATDSGRAEALSFVAPVAYTLDWLILFSDKSKTLSLGVMSVVGVVIGSAIVALATRTFRWEGFAGAEDTANHVVGGLLMGVGGVTAMGCTVGQGLTGISTLSLTSAVALVFIMAGAVAGIKYQVWRLERMA